MRMPHLRQKRQQHPAHSRHHKPQTLSLIRPVRFAAVQAAVEVAVCRGFFGGKGVVGVVDGGGGGGVGVLHGVHGYVSVVGWGVSV